MSIALVLDIRASSLHPGTSRWHGILTPLLSPHASALACPQGGGPGAPCPALGTLSPPVPWSQSVTRSQEGSGSDHLQTPPLQHHFSSTRGKKERCQNQPSSSCKHGKPHFIQLKLP